MSFLIIYILLLHFIGDFVLQPDWMARGKSKNNSTLGVHVLIYGGVLWFGLVFISVFKLQWFQVQAFVPIIYPLINALIHFGVDHVTSRINAKLWASGDAHNFFVGVGADQFIHAATLILTLNLFL